MAQLRLDKYLADAGIGTRSEIKAYVRKGFVRINGSPAKKPDVHLDEEKDSVTFKGELIRHTPYVYFLLNKPAGYVSAVKDNTAPTVLSLIDNRYNGLFPVGRLDKDTEGLLLITNDGALSHKLLSPRRHVDKTYYAAVEGKVTDTDIQTFEQGVAVGDEDLDVALPARLRLLTTEQKEDSFLSYIEVTVHEGKFHQIKRMFRAVGKKVVYLKRTGFGPLALPADLPTGAYRELTKQELEELKSCC
ncbi:MAG: rRNA pseudouridine synthase [Bacteroidales bacterium]|nr:rRNA pseudouridine synthase [Clostridium sp.]MCM1204056.1 rRNA pseudouridine synthase [Bacteroidales bacterium]